MKKVFVTILAIVYLTSSVGAMVSIHYCMDKLVTWSFGDERKNNKSCPYCGDDNTNSEKQCEKESKGCCKDEHRIIKLEGDQKTSEAALKFTLTKIEVNTLFNTDCTPDHSSVLSNKEPLSNAPPRTQEVLLFILNCVFRI